MTNTPALSGAPLVARQGGSKTLATILLALAACTADPAANDVHDVDAATPFDAGDAGESDGGRPAEDAGGDPLPTPPGTLEVISDDCGAGPGSLPGATCRTVRVSCPDVAPAEAQVRVAAPPDGVAVRGTVIFGTGGGGNGFYENDPVARTIVERVSAAGFQVVERAWGGTTGWLTGPGGWGPLSCRYATLLAWIASDVHEEGAICATGNSGGSAEISYALSRWGMSSTLDLAVPTSGPHSRLDLGCIGEPEWDADCALSALPADWLPEWECSFGRGACSLASSAELVDAAYLPDTPCGDADPADAPLLHADSVFAPDAVLDFPDTLVHFLYGRLDCSTAVTLGLTFANAVTSEKILGSVPATPHALFSTPEGADAIVLAIEEGCLPR